MKDYSWSKGDQSCYMMVPQESIPARVALTATGVVTKRPSQGSGVHLLLCNPHPDSWNSWMLPYGSLAVEPSDLEVGVTFGVLAAIMEDLRNREAGSYEAKALAEVKKLAGMADYGFRLEEALANFSLKFSKSANVWTAYCFAYHISQDGEKAKPSVQATWLSLDDKTVKDVLNSKQFNGLAVADNVLALLQNNKMLNLLR
ncbi:MAG TPA: hypothetical protein DCZ97_15895 [Syntrophus sp. (in: bacteria)]|nr:hypothetical protein [Syntrophus sp. (in: bacteria)]